ncbi:unnamed protein product [Protopolystoma xenopodis]|uniref:BROMI C-terminal Rab TBC-like domain-containing protein n=1 Tax=Protopolystoma xenopodis TaxID=117903 RepID=A0A448XGU6_9PLAT|nr:unnamed protein product [Protopolystoma xenopodis]
MCICRRMPKKACSEANNDLFQAPSDGTLPMLYKTCHLVEVILARECPSVFNIFRLSGFPASQVIYHWFSQCLWNYLDWSGVLDYLFVVMLHGPAYQVFMGVALLRYIGPCLRRAMQEEPIYGFNITEHLSFLHKLNATYGVQVNEALKRPLEIS